MLRHVRAPRVFPELVSSFAGHRMARIDSHTRPAVPRFGNRAHRTRKNVYSPFTPAIVLSSPRASVPFPRSEGFSRGLFGTDPKERKNKRKKRKEREPETKRKKNKEQETREREKERETMEQTAGVCSSLALFSPLLHLPSLRP